MGQKVHPIGFRLGFIKTWNSRWYADKDYPHLLIEDLRIREFLKKKLYHAGVSRIEIERVASKAKKAKVTIHTARPGIIIGKKGAEVENLRKALQKLTKKEIFINIQEVKRAEIDAQLVAENVALQLERRVGFRRVMKKAVTSAMKLGAKGIKIACAGRLGGAEMARREWYREGRVPLHTLRADIDFGQAEGRTTYGQIGVKVWLFKGEIFPTKEVEERATYQ
ncbi:MAG: ribosomal protein [Deltaproteobacteria bacterium]|nr:ribosomal protein [Deltaproteobacteria bacterium]